jgi:hypothetical protein
MAKAAGVVPTAQAPASVSSLYLDDDGGIPPEDVDLLTGAGSGPEEERDPRLRTPEGRADVALAEAIGAAEVKLSLSEMIYAMDLEMVLVEGSQRARLVGGFIDIPDKEQVARIARFACVIRFLKMCHERPGDTAAHFAKVAKKRAAGD